jgi:peptidoglycan/xylan/chitin deacetylase (PgdA/CDA1 family)
MIPPIRILLALALSICAVSWAALDLLNAGRVSAVTTKPSITHVQKVSIIGFHDIVDLQNPNNLPPHRREFDSDYTKQDLEKFLSYLLQNNYWFLSTEEFYDYFLKKTKKIPPENLAQKPVMITFDDGYKGMYNNVLPLLENLEKTYHKKVKVVLFINPGLMNVVDGDLYYVSCDNLKEGLQKGFFDIQSHSLTHQKLTELTEKEIVFELSKSKFILRQCTEDLDPEKKVASYLAYPNGATNKKVEQYTSAYYDAGFLYDNKVFEINSISNNRFRVHRLMAYRGMSPEHLIKLVKKNEELNTKQNKNSLNSSALDK